MGSFFSSVIASQTNNFLKIKVSNAIEIKNILINLFNSNTKIRLKYSQYQLLQEITKKFDSIYLKKCIECFKSNINNLNDAFEQCDTFIELQEKIFDLNEENFQETYLFIQDQIQNSDLKPDVAFQIELASALRPKYNKLFNQLYVNIKTYIDPKFPCEIYQFDLSETEMILINDDSSALLELLSKNPNFYREMHVSLKNYTISSKEGNLWLLSYILTPKGFDDITKRKNGFKRKKGTLKDFQFHSNVSSQDTDENQNDFIRQKTIETFYQEETQQVDPTITVTKQEVKSYFKRALSGISEICDILKYSKDEKEIVEKQFDAYLLNSFKEACPNFRPTIDGNSYNWEIIMEDPLFRNFADIALRLEPTPCSEASAERAISLQRLVILKRRNKALKELIDARLIYMRCQTKKFLDKYYF